MLRLHGIGARRQSGHKPRGLWHERLQSEERAAPCRQLAVKLLDVEAEKALAQVALLATQELAGRSVVRVARRSRGDFGAQPLSQVPELRALCAIGAEIVAKLGDGMFAVPKEKVARVHASSGTTGKPTVVGYTRSDINTWADLVARSLRAAGARPGMLVHIAVGYGLFTGGLGMHYGAEKLDCMVIPVASGMTERQVQLILDFQPDIIIPTPSYLLVILDEFRRRGLDLADMLRKAMSSSMRCLSGDICLVISVLPLKRSAHAAPVTVTARLRLGRWRWSSQCRKGNLALNRYRGTASNEGSARTGRVSGPTSCSVT